MLDMVKTICNQIEVCFYSPANTTFIVLDAQRSGRIIADILEMFAPARSESNGQQKPPYGFNRRMTEEERLGVQPTSNLR
jgi:hypothetical protein